MATENPVYSVLVTNGNQALATKGGVLGGTGVLKHGQLGIFNFHTGVAVDKNSTAAELGDTRDLVIAVGINRSNPVITADMEDYRKNAGQIIQVRNTKAITAKGYNTEAAKIVDVSGFTAMCETLYLLKIEFRNQSSYYTNGYNACMKTFSYYTGCCAQNAACDDCVAVAGNPAELANGLMLAINADPDQLVTASLLASKSNATVTAAATASGTIIVGIGTDLYSVPIVSGDTVATVATKIAAAINTATAGATSGNYEANTTGAVINAYASKSSQATPTADITIVSAGGTGVTIGATTKANVAVTDYTTLPVGAGATIRITGNAEVRPPSNGGINIKYHKTGLDFLVTLSEGVNQCNGIVTTVQPVRYMEGSGYDIQQLEYEASGWQGNLYRQSSVTGLQKGNAEYLSSPSATYNVVALTYDQFSVGGWLEYLNNLQTIIAVPCADSTTLGDLFAAFKVIFTQFSDMTDDVAGMGCSSAITSTKTHATDGIESLG